LALQPLRQLGDLLRDILQLPTLHLPVAIGKLQRARRRRFMEAIGETLEVPRQERHGVGIFLAPRLFFRFITDTTAPGQLLVEGGNQLGGNGGVHQRCLKLCEFGRAFAALTYSDSPCAASRPTAQPLCGYSRGVESSARDTCANCDVDRS
jgi:hypothetical protein